SSTSSKIQNHHFSVKKSRKSRSILKRDDQVLSSGTSLKKWYLFAREHLRKFLDSAVEFLSMESQRFWIWQTARKSFNAPTQKMMMDIAFLLSLLERYLLTIFVNGTLSAT